MRPVTPANLAAMLLLLALPVCAGEARVELIPRIQIWKPANWDLPVMPHLTTGVTADSALTIPPALTETQPTWFEYAESYNAAAQGYWTDQLTLDGVPIQTVMRANLAWAAGTAYSFDVGPYYLMGGRHVVTATCDLYHDIGEDSEWWGDNTYPASFLWTPPALAAGVVTGTVHAPPPPPGNVAFAITRATPAAWAVALTMSGGDDDDLVLYDDFVNSTSGLSHERARSAVAGDSLELIVGAGDVTPATLYPAVLRSAVGPGWGAAVGWVTADGRSGGGEQMWDSESLAVRQAAQVYEADLQAGVAYPMSVWRGVGSTPLALAVFPPTPGAVFALRQAVGRSTPFPGQDYASLVFTPTVSGKHLLVVYRSGFPWEIARYALAVGSQAVRVGDRVAPFDAARILGVQPNPARERVRIAFATPRIAPARLALVDVSGRRVATVHDGLLDAGRHEFDVPTRDDTGRRLPAGLYWARLEAGGSTTSARIVILR